jgi:hypothetical protein
MDIDQKLEKFKHHFKSKDRPFQKLDAQIETDMGADAETKQQDFDTPVGKQMVQEFYLIKEENDVLNKEISKKEIETELLRRDQIHY